MVGIGTGVQAASCGYKHTLALTEKGEVFGMGSNTRHELGLGTASNGKYFSPVHINALDDNTVTKVVAGSFSIAITSRSEVLIWGTGEFGNFASPQKMYLDDIRFTDIAISKQQNSFCAAVDEQGLLYSWGQN